MDCISACVKKLHWVDSGRSALPSKVEDTGKSSSAGACRTPHLYEALTNVPAEGREERRKKQRLRKWIEDTRQYDLPFELQFGLRGLPSGKVVSSTLRNSAHPVLYSSH